MREVAKTWTCREWRTLGEGFVASHEFWAFEGWPVWFADDECGTRLCALS